jgi:predicted O-methyltransferase YrrM
MDTPETSTSCPSVRDYSTTPSVEPTLDEIIVRGNRRMTVHDLTLLDQHARSIGAKTLVEIGSMDGCSSMILGRVARDNRGNLYCYEPRPKGRWFANIRELDLENHVYMIQHASPWIPREHLPIASPVDFVLIDGDHRTTRAITDYVFWARFVRPGGLIAFHDIDGGKGVAAFVRTAVSLCVTDDNLKNEQGPDYRIHEIARTPEARDRGTIIFEKRADSSKWFPPYACGEEI